MLVVNGVPHPLLVEIQYHTNTAKNKLCCFSFPNLSGLDKYTALTAPCINPTMLYKAEHQKATMLSTTFLQENDSPFLPVPTCGQRLVILKLFLFYMYLCLWKQNPWYEITGSQKCLGWKRSYRSFIFHLPCHRQGCHSLEQIDQGPIQPGLELFQKRGSELHVSYPELCKASHLLRPSCFFLLIMVMSSCLLMNWNHGLINMDF